MRKPFTVPRRFAISHQNRWMLQQADYVVGYIHPPLGRRSAIFCSGKAAGKAGDQSGRGTVLLILPFNANHPQHVKPEGHPLPFSMLRAIRRDNHRQFTAAVKPLDTTLHLHHLLCRLANSSSGRLTCQTELSSLTIKPSSCNARNTLKTCAFEHPVCRTTLFCLPRNKSEDLYK